MLDHAVDLFFGLRSRTPRIGNISRIARRIRPELELIGGNSEHRRTVLDRKGRVWRPFLARRTTFSKIKDLWPGRQDSNYKLPISIFALAKPEGFELANLCKAQFCYSGDLSTSSTSTEVQRIIRRTENISADAPLTGIQRHSAVEAKGQGLLNRNPARRRMESV